MKIVTYTYSQNSTLGLLIGDKIYPLNAIASTINDFFQVCICPHDARAFDLITNCTEVILLITILMF